MASVPLIRCRLGLRANHNGLDSGKYGELCNSNSNCVYFRKDKMFHNNNF